MESSSAVSKNEGGTSILARPIQCLGCVVLTIVGVACTHSLLHHLRVIFVPFVFSGFIVLALQPSVEFIYQCLAGLRPPFRWFCCGPSRRRQGEDAVERGYWGCLDFESEDDETAPLMPSWSGESQTAGGFAKQVGEGLARFFAVTLVLGMVVVVGVLMFLLLCQGAIHMKDNWEAYKSGIMRMEMWYDSLIDWLTLQVPASKKHHLDVRLKEFYQELLYKSKDGIWYSLNRIVSGVSEGLSFSLLLLLYVLFWLFAPLPTGGKAGALVRSYIYKKTFVSALFGICVAILFASLGIDLAVLFGMISFFLNYLPEVGAFISMLFPIPVIVLDGRLHHPLFVLSFALVGQLVLKLVFSNVLEVKLIESDREMSVHPVWVILGLSYFGFIWGPVGMLISVPILAMLKTALMSMASAAHSDDDVTLGVVEGLLACLEGRKSPANQTEYLTKDKEEDETRQLEAPGPEPRPVRGRGCQLQ
eukprot:TRINITY_DN110240_c0_g1_i1.p1 TRINITY_DN110240_c0_g1~~TRINITY_DN110240_c0_g1_i1.p1  ORF type:complete len:475 (+),score=39.60 TRINITY_DN110240_c0_g1_i1:115-1539(+)